MKVLVALCAVVACCVANPAGGFAYSAIAPSLNYATAPAVYATAPAVSYAAPSVYAASSVLDAPAISSQVVAAAPAPIAYATPAVAPSVLAAPAISSQVVAAAPVPIAYGAPAVKTIAAAPVVAAAPAVAAAPFVAGVKTQYHAQDELGQVSYGHSEPGQVHNAVQDAYGNKIGSFSYVNPEGNVLRTDYVADGAGYRVASNALPAGPIVQPVDTPEVAVAKANFYAQYNAEASKVRARRSVFGQTPASTQPLAIAAVASPGAKVIAPVPAPVAYSASIVSSAVSPLSYTSSAPVSYAAAAVPAPVSYAAAVPAPVSYAATVPALASYYAPIQAPVSYAAPIQAPVSYAAPIQAPVSYAAAVPAPVQYAASTVSYSTPAVVAAADPALRAATLTTVISDPGNTVSYRID